MAFENRLMKKIPALEENIVETREEGVFEESADVDETDGNNAGGGIWVDKHEPSPGIAMTADTFEYKEITNSEVQNFVKFALQPYQPVPNEKDYEKGFFMRYFIKRYDNRPIEVSKETWDDVSQILPKKIYNHTRVRWNLSAEKIDFPTTNLVKQGKSQELLLKHIEVGELDNDLEKINERYVKLANNRMPGLLDYFNGSYLDYTVTGNSSIQGNQYTSGNEYYKPNGDEYIGYYHIHSTKGAMVGKTHTSKPHDILIHKSQLDTKGSSVNIAMPKTQEKKVSYLYESPTQTDSGMGGGYSSGGDSGGSAPAPSSGGGSGGY